MTWRLPGFCLLLLLLPPALAAAPQANAQTAPAPASAPAGPPGASLPRYLVYFNEFSAYLSPRSKAIIARVAKQAQREGVKKIIVQARASATGTVVTNKYLAMTRASIVADELASDGVSPATIEQEPIGQTGSGDPSVFNRRVDIVLTR